MNAPSSIPKYRKGCFFGIKDGVFGLAKINSSTCLGITKIASSKNGIFFSKRLGIKIFYATLINKAFR
jgi:hypothetical protein